MKKILPLTLSFCGAALLIGSLVAAKDAPPPPAPAVPAPMAAAPKPGPGGPMERMLSERLGLTDEQQKKLEAVRGEIMRRRHERQEQMGFAGQRRGGPQGFGPGPQQGFGFAQQQGPQGPQAHRPAGPMKMIQQGNRMAAEGQRQLARQLGLSEEQSAKLRDMARQHEEKAQAMQKEFREQMLSVLTPEQQARVKAMHERRGPGGERGPGPGRPDMPPPGK